MLSKGLIRIPLTLPATRDFDVQVVLNPYASAGANPPQNTVIAPTATPELSFYRRPLLSANTRFIAAVMWDGREATVSPVPANPKDVDGSGIQAFQADAPVRTNMLTQANDATRGHAQGAVDLTAAQRAAIVDFQMNLVVAQESDNIVGRAESGGRHRRANGAAHAADVLRHQRLARRQPVRHCVQSERDDDVRRAGPGCRAIR